MDRDKKIDCNLCRYYFITWEPSTPFGCRAMGFKSHRIPSAVVHQHSGAPCRAFQRKKSKIAQR
jgi:hypothetical protein